MDTQKLLRVIFAIVILGLIAWAVMAFLPIPYPFPQIIVFVLVVAALLYAFKALGGGSL